VYAVVLECEALCRDCSEALSLPCFREAAVEKYIALSPVRCQVLRPASPYACIATYSGVATCWQARRGRCAGTVVAEDSAEPLNLKPMCASKIVQCNSMIQKSEIAVHLCGNKPRVRVGIVELVYTHAYGCEEVPHTVCPHLIYPVLTTRLAVQTLDRQKSKVASSPQFRTGDEELSTKVN
jgi:hypothetical protein